MGKEVAQISNGISNPVIAGLYKKYCFCDMEEFHNGIHKGVYNNPHRLAECNIIQFVHQEEKQFTKCFVIRVSSLGDRKHHIPCEHNGYMGIQQKIKRWANIFITHGGMNSVNEGLYFENRILGIPMDLDQYAVVEQVEKLKLGYRLEKERVTPELLREKVKELLLDDEIGHKVKDMSMIMRNAGGVKRAAEFVEKIFMLPV